MCGQDIWLNIKEFKKIFLTEIYFTVIVVVIGFVVDIELEGEVGGEEATTDADADIDLDDDEGVNDDDNWNEDDGFEEEE